MTRLWNPSSLTAHKNKKPPLVCLAVASAALARIADDGVDVILVGDSLGMTIYGDHDTKSVTMAMMERHGRAVVSATLRAMVVVDLPFERDKNVSLQQKCEECHQLLESTGASAVKIEGGAESAAKIDYFVQNGIKVMGHVGLMPQYATPHGGRYKMAGQSKKERKKIMEDAHAIAGAGVFSLVVECVPELLARAITHALAIPVIGIGASPACDGQILVATDIVGLTQNKARFVRSYGDISPTISTSFARYAEDVRNGDFPNLDECYAVEESEK